MSVRAPAACDDPRVEGFPCFGKHKEGKMRQNQHAAWSQCVQCGLRLAYVSKKVAGGHTRQMGPDPHLIRLAMASIKKIAPPDQVTADMVNGKLMEIKGTMLQMGIKTSLAINMTLKEYEERLERYGRADGKPLVTVKSQEGEGKLGSPIDTGDDSAGISGGFEDLPKLSRGEDRPEGRHQEDDGLQAKPVAITRQEIQSIGPFEARASDPSGGGEPGHRCDLGGRAHGHGEWPLGPKRRLSQTIAALWERLREVRMKKTAIHDG